MIQLQVIGNLVADAEVKTISGVDYAATRIAVNVSKEHTEFVSLRKRLGEKRDFVQYLSKGRKVYVQGKMSVQAYISKTTNEATPDVTLWADTIELLNQTAQEQKSF